jgi:hypothetical protein
MTVSVAIGTWLFGWWAVPIIAMIAGLLRCGAGVTAIASATAWMILLAIDATSGAVPRVASTLAGIMGLPAAAIYLLTLVFPALLGWSAASLGNAARSLRATSRQPS